MSTYEYKGYLGSAEIDTDSGALVGKLLFIRDTITYSATTAPGLREAFEEAVEDYLAACAELGDEPDKPCKGTFQVRIAPDLHRCVAIEARRLGVSLNSFVERALLVACSSKTEHHTHLTLHVENVASDRHIVAASAPTHWEAPSARH